MNDLQLAATGCVLLVAVLYFIAVRAARRHAWNSRLLIVLSAVSGVALLVMVLTDWPGEQLSHFWADHSIFSAVLSSLLLVSLGYLGFEAGETRDQAELSDSVTTAGLSGLVDHLVDVDIALSMLGHPSPPGEFSIEGRPLKWLRPIREQLQREAEPLEKGELRFRLELPFKPGPAGDPHPEWRLLLLDQCVRRIMAGMRDWAAVLAISEDGRRVLKRLGRVRLRLLDIEKRLRRDPNAEHRDIDSFCGYLQLLALALERISAGDYMRPGVIAVLPRDSARTDARRAQTIKVLTTGAITVRSALRAIDAGLDSPTKAGPT